MGGKNLNLVHLLLVLDVVSGSRLNIRLSLIQLDDFQLILLLS